ncbi:hypothetical protein NE237_002308 [Protea cynaroides]|uniref:Uncharacterized protein n=1 Tax=Protea cynaroides TaxID=273540 RepID=A0A9Q0QZ81_9MAGN|nr:hypothetical protein NE237_002308 [Protea cynaroides]
MEENGESEEMAAKPLTSEAIARTEKKMDMTLDDIIKMSKKPDFKFKNQRVPVKGCSCSVRARALGRNRMVNWNKPRIGAPPAQWRVSERGFPGKLQQAKVVTKQRPQTLDSLFANMKEQRMRALSHSQQMNSQRTGGFQQRGRGRFNN